MRLSSPQLCSVLPLITPALLPVWSSFMRHSGKPSTWLLRQCFCVTVICSESLCAPCSLFVHAPIPPIPAPACSEGAELTTAAEQTQNEIRLHCLKFQRSQMQGIIRRIDSSRFTSSLSKPLLIEMIVKIAPANFIQTYPHSWKEPSDALLSDQKEPSDVLLPDQISKHIKRPRHTRVTSLSGPGLADCSWIGQFQRFDDNDFWFCVPPKNLQKTYEIRMQKVQAAFLRKRINIADQPNMEFSGEGHDDAVSCAGFECDDTHTAVVSSASCIERVHVETLTIEMGDSHSAPITARPSSRFVQRCSSRHRITALRLMSCCSPACLASHHSLQFQ